VRLPFCLSSSPFSLLPPFCPLFSSPSSLPYSFAHLSNKPNWLSHHLPDPERYYGFSLFALQLNELTPIEDGFLAPTDSRLRPDQSAFEHGDVDKAEALKAQVEEKQRAKRREGKEPKPRWFREEEEGKWKYTGEYCASPSTFARPSLPSTELTLLSLLQSTFGRNMPSPTPTSSSKPSHAALV
jgi:hypothetical protein